MLAERVDELLDEVVRRSAGEAAVPAVTPAEVADTAPLDVPIEEEFRVGTMALAWDGDDERVVIEAQALAEDEAEDDEPPLIDATTRRRAAAAAGAADRRRGPGLRRARAGRRGRRPAAVPVLRRPARRRRATSARGPTATGADGAEVARWRARRRPTALDLLRARRDRPSRAGWSTRPTRRCSARSARTRRRARAASTSRSRGERPLWDFPDGTLAGREVAAYACPRRPAGTSCRRPCCATGRSARAWCQLWIDTDDDDDDRWSTSMAPAALPAGLAARARRARLRRRAGGARRTPTTRGCAGWRCSTSSLNNADRKGGHLLPRPDGAVLRRRPRRLASTPSPSCAPCCGAGRASRCGRRGGRGAGRGCATTCSTAARHRRWPSCCSPARGRGLPPPGRPAAARGPAARTPARAGRRSPGRRSDRERPRRIPAVHAWPAPDVPDLPGSGPAAAAARHRDRRGRGRPRPGPTARMYVCGITPYDATHLGHAATYVTFDLVHRVWLDAGHDVHYVQNVTDVDDPLLERAPRDGEDWRALAERETDAVPRGHDRAARCSRRATTSARSRRSRTIVDAVERLRDARRGVRRRGRHLLLGARRPAVRRRRRPRRRRRCSRCSPSAAATRTGRARSTRSTRLLWQAARPGEPSLGRRRARPPGRPGWHVECAAIALRPPRRRRSTCRAAAATWSSRTTR